MPATVLHCRHPGCPACPEACASLHSLGAQRLWEAALHYGRAGAKNSRDRSCHCATSSEWVEPCHPRELFQSIHKFRPELRVGEVTKDVPEGNTTEHTFTKAGCRKSKIETAPENTVPYCVL